MWVRKQIDISFSQLFWGVVSCLLPASHQRLAQGIKKLFPPSDQLLVSLSVRSGFELLWSSLDLEEGSDVIMSGFTIPDMARIVERHGLNVIPVDIDPLSLAPDIREIRQKITPKTRAIVVAHLWGGLMDLTEIVQLAREHDLLLIEDCAQAYTGNDYPGDPRSDVAMFSFGTIKTNTALGGAVLRVESSDIRQRMEQIQQAWPTQSRFGYFKRLIKYLWVKTISTRPCARMISQVFRWLGTNHDSFASRLARGFSGRNFFKRIRKRPSGPLLSMLLRRLSSFDQETVLRRCQLGHRLANLLMGFDEDSIGAPLIVGVDCERQTYWLFGVLVDDPQGLAQELWKAGFDATHQSSMHSLYTGKRGSIQLLGCESIEQNLLLVPLDIKMQASEIDRLADVIRSSKSSFCQLAQKDFSTLSKRQSEEHADA